MRYMSVLTTSKRFGVSRQMVWLMIKSGRLKAIRVGKLYRIPVSEVERIEKKQD